MTQEGLPPGQRQKHKQKQANKIKTVKHTKINFKISLIHDLYTTGISSKYDFWPNCNVAVVPTITLTFISEYVCSLVPCPNDENCSSHISAHTHILESSTKVILRPQFSLFSELECEYYIYENKASNST